MLKCLPADLPLYCRSGNQGAYNKVQTNQLLSAVLVQWIFKHLIIKANLYAGQFSEQDGNSLGADARALTHEEELLKKHREYIYLGPPIRWTLPRPSLCWIDAQIKTVNLLHSAFVNWTVAQRQCRAHQQCWSGYLWQKKTFLQFLVFLQLLNSLEIALHAAIYLFILQNCLVIAHKYVNKFQLWLWYIHFQHLVLLIHRVCGWAAASGHWSQSLSHFSFISVTLAVL